jgi:putative membrane protein
VARIIPGILVEDYLSAFLVALALAFLNTIVKPILTVLTIPITIFTLGLFLLVINAMIILFAGQLVKGFHVEGFWPALWFSIVLSIFTGILNSFVGVREREED